jgi:uncharacterized protein
MVGMMKLCPPYISVSRNSGFLPSAPSTFCHPSSVMMLETLAPFTIGLVGSLHCLGMCGPLVLAYSLHYKSAVNSETPTVFGAFFHHLAFHTGRIITYGIMGAIVAGIFESLEVQKFGMLYRGGFVIVSGILLLALGLVILKALPLPFSSGWLSSPAGLALAKKMRDMASSRSAASKIGLGLSAGLLPCGLTWAMLVTAASTLNPAGGFLTMFSFGLGTIPLLLLTGVSASFISTKVRLLGERAAGFFVMVMGVILLVKGIGMMSGMIGQCG